MKTTMLAVCAGMAAGVYAQTAPPPSHEVPWRADSGLLAAPAKGARTLYETTVFVPNAAWLRLRFSELSFSGVVEEGSGAMLRITSLQDGAVQFLNAESARQWCNTSAYFNGDAVHVELIARPGAGASRVAIDRVTAGSPEVGGADTICGPTDDRVLSSDPRSSRHLPEGCSTWLFNDTNHMFMTAGHCGISAADVQQFNVPLSTAGGATVNPGPQDQYPVEPASVQFINGGIGNDYCYFATSVNSNTGLTAFQKQGQFYTIASAAPVAAGQTLRIIGYGTTSSPISPTWNQVQKTHSGPYFALSGTTVQHQVDTTGGNSGSAVENLDDVGKVIAIHTHAGCTSTGGFNSSTAIQLGVLQNAVNNPLSLCKSGRGTPGGAVFVIGDGANNFGTLSTSTGNFAKVKDEPPRMEGLAYNRNAGYFYGISNDTYGVAPGPAGMKLWTINPATGVATYVTNVSSSAGIINGLGHAAAANILYGVVQSTGTRVIINTASGAVTVDGAANAGTTIGAAEYDDVTGMLYGIDDSGGASKLVRFTPATGAVQLIGSLGAGIGDCNGLAVTADGFMWAINAATDQLLRINKDTGAATVTGATNGQFGASFGMSAVQGPLAPACYANCDDSTIAPILNVQDFSCFLNRFAAGESYANCDNSTTAPVLNVLDFSCFLNLFANGCT